MARTGKPAGRAARRRDARAARDAPLDLDGLRARVARAAIPGPADRAERARRLLSAWIGTAAAHGASLRDIVRGLGNGSAAEQLRGALETEISRNPPPVLRDAACRAGCAFCCILDGPDGGTITEVEARRMHGALAPLAGRPDGRDWHPAACPALDPETRTCRAYDERPGLCRAYLSSDAEACRINAEGGAAPGAGLLSTHPDALAVHGLARAALRGVVRVETFALARLNAAALEGRDVDAALDAARHPPKMLDEALRGLVSSAAAARRR
ncbi:Fe-S-cluster containining protein [Palleronia aestuarii]|uniref:Fe-S-cluster containining protein n=1 Tax=Palleronia aestuarii TaxID=568105 RepID=A0A2W7N7D6_9RHOB|nr:YkgJ family cysteine cluster protein [Palleronia aestuarii]PZX15978.1 Fe-S-cluster containining protein [Palleronia aestuarii]